MRPTVLRVGVGLMLLATGVWAAITLAGLERRIAPGDPIGRQLDRLQLMVTELGLTQAGYVIANEDPDQSVGSVAALFASITGATAEIGPLVRTAEGNSALQTLVDGTSRLAQADAQARDGLRIGDVWSASQIVRGEASNARRSMQDAVATLRTAESAAREQDRNQALAGARLTLGAGACVWVAGVVVLMFVRSATRDRIEPGAGSAPVATGNQPPIDLDAIGDICMEIARVDTSAGIDALLARAGRALDAARVVLWVGAADELVPVMVHGDDTQSPRPTPLRRDADRPAARAWRRATLQTVPADAGSCGEILAPMIGATGCGGVLAVELRHGWETHPIVRGAIVMIAAQLSAAVTGTPSTSSTAGLSSGS